MLAQQAAQLDKTSMRMAFILALLGLRHEGRPRADAHLEAGRLQRSAGAVGRDSLDRHAELRDLRPDPLLRAHQPLPGRRSIPGGLLLLLGMFSMGIAVPFVLVQKNFRRLLAYSTIDQAGIMVTALGIGGKLGALALMLHMTFHTVAKSLLFLCAGNIDQRFKTDLFAEDQGRRDPRDAADRRGASSWRCWRLSGMPPFSLFQSEFLMVRAAFGGGHYVPGALFILFGTGVFAGMALHVSGLVLGPSDGRARGRCTRGATARWWRSRPCWS